MTDESIESQNKESEIRTAKIRRHFDFALTDADYKRLATEYATISRQKRTLEAELEDKKAELKGAIDKLTAGINRIARLYDAEKESREVEAKVVFDFNAATVSYWHQNMLLEERAMTADERQIEMGPVLVSKPAKPSEDDQVVEGLSSYTGSEAE